MKNYTKLTLAVAFASAFTLANQVKGDDVTRTPKGESLRTSTITAPATSDTDLVRSQPVMGNARAQFRHPSVASSTGESASGDRSSYTGRNPIRELRGEQFEIAPLKNSGKECSTDKSCCEKK